LSGGVDIMKKVTMQHASAAVTTNCDLGDYGGIGLHYLRQLLDDRLIGLVRRVGSAIH
jgi:hypothetical protein